MDNKIQGDEKHKMEPDEIVKYVMDTPDNTNPRILREMLNTVSPGPSPTPTGEEFVIMLTPESEDYSGYMDKKISEIYAAWTSKKQLIFKMDLGSSFIYATCNVIYDISTSGCYPYFYATMIDDSASLIRSVFCGGISTEGDTQQYTAITYALSSTNPTPLVCYADENHNRSDMSDSYYELNETFSTILNAYLAGRTVRIIIRITYYNDEPLEEPEVIEIRDITNYTPENQAFNFFREDGSSQILIKDDYYPSSDDKAVYIAY